MVTFILQVVLTLMTFIIAAGLLYHYLLLFAGQRSRGSGTAKPGEPTLRFALAIPAHDEAGVIAATVQQLRRLAYPADLFYWTLVFFTFVTDYPDFHGKIRKIQRKIRGNPCNLWLKMPSYTANVIFARLQFLYPRRSRLL